MNFHDFFIIFQIANLPIDIHVGKLVDWLVSRQHATKDWTHVTRSIREKINEAIQDMPEHPEITKLLSGTCMYIK